MSQKAHNVGEHTRWQPTKLMTVRYCCCPRAKALYFCIAVCAALTLLPVYCIEIQTYRRNAHYTAAALTVVDWCLGSTS